MFIKRFWGFDPVYWPIVSFSQNGSLDALLAQSQPGDTIVFVGTQGPETKEQEQGKLLGFAELGRGRASWTVAVRRTSPCRDCLNPFRHRGVSSATH